MDSDRTQEPTRRLKVDLGELEMAFEDGSDDTEWYLDVETGELDFTSDYLPQEDLDEVRQKLDERGDRMLRVPAEGSSEGYAAIKGFGSSWRWPSTVVALSAGSRMYLRVMKMNGRAGISLRLSGREAV